MKKNRKVNSNVIVFSKWTRKSYAIFASLRKIVNIARLSIAVCKASLLKNQTIIRLIDLLSTEDSEYIEIEETDLLEKLELLLISVPNTKKAYKQNIALANNLLSPYFEFIRVWAFLFLNHIEGLLCSSSVENNKLLIKT